MQFNLLATLLRINNYNTRQKLCEILTGSVEFDVFATNRNKKLSYRRGTARRSMSVEILSTAAQLYEK